MRTYPYRSFIGFLLTLGLILPVPAWGQDEQAGETVEPLPRQTGRRITYKDFYDLQTSVEELRRQMNQLRVDVEAYKSREMTPEVYRSILRRVQPPKLTHEIVMTNGTVVRGNIITENIDELTIETSVGNLTLDKSNIRSIQDIAGLKPKIEFQGDAREEIYDDHRVFTGVVRNDGISRGDFVRVIFKLWNAKTELVAQDSAFVDGATIPYLSGVVTDTALEPGQTAEYYVTVNVDKSNPVSYITREIHWDRMD
ncbi:MAG: hypothetical protein JSU77_07345 [Fidelibacterota bacterium]|nr:MAG: hypothetical protein JSU77_07345 [Candidatus Neomarinimicrobiota bacterium]